MAASDGVGRVSEPLSDANTANGRRAGRSLALPWAIAAVTVGAGLYFFPLFHVVPLSKRAAGSSDAATAAFDPVSFVDKFWRERLQPATAKAADAAPVLAALKRDPAAAARKHAHQVGIGSTAYYFVRGTGKVVSAEKNQVVVAVDGAEGAQVALKVGPLFGNTVRDGTGLLNVNQFPGLQEFNALSAELNRAIEEKVFPAVRERAVVGATITFAGCAEAPESVGPGPLLAVVPLAIGGGQ